MRYAKDYPYCHFANYSTLTNDIYVIEGKS